MLTLLLALASAAPDTLARGAAQPGGPAITVHRQPALPVVSLRLSLLVDDPPGYAGAGHLIQHLHLPALQEQAARVGARVQAQRSADALVYSVTGPVAELEHLASVLRSALRAPQPGPPELLVALNALAEERAAEREIAAEYVRAALRARLLPEELPAAGTAAGMQRVEAGALPEVWAEMYAPERVSVVAVGAVEVEDVQRVLRALPAGASAGRLPQAIDTVRPIAADTPQATRHWIAWGALAGGSDPAALSVAGRLLRNRLRRVMPNSQVDVEHWWTHRGQALAVVVATSAARAAAARRTVEGALAALEAELGEAAVRQAAGAVRRDLLFFVRTPERMAEVVGSFADRTGDPDAAQQFYGRLAEVSEQDVRAALADLRGAEQVRLEVAPQRVGGG